MGFSRAGLSRTIDGQSMSQKAAPGDACPVSAANGGLHLSESAATLDPLGAEFISP